MKLQPTAKTLSFFHASDKFPADLTTAENRESW